jgi:hypothetical protein
VCLIIAGVFMYLSYSFYIDNNILNASINGFIAVFFVILLIRNIIKSKKYIKEKENKK